MTLKRWIVQAGSAIVVMTLAVACAPTPVNSAQDDPAQADTAQADTAQADTASGEATQDTSQDDADQANTGTVDLLASVAGFGGDHAISRSLRIGGSAEFEVHKEGLPALESRYGVFFDSFVELDASGPITMQALAVGDVDAANIFTTEPAIGLMNFIVLEDLRDVFVAQNVTPLIRAEKATPEVAAVLNELSAALLTADLQFLNRKVAIDGRSPDDIGPSWVEDQEFSTGSSLAGMDLVIASTNSEESDTLAYIYGAMLENNGATVRWEIAAGNHEDYIPAMIAGTIDLTVEYSGQLLQHFDPASDESTPDRVYRALVDVLPAELRVLEPSDAENKSAIAVTKATAEEYGLSSIGDLIRPLGGKP